MPLTLLSPAKINLFLKVIGKRPDGYHNLQTVFQFLDFGDLIHFNLIKKPEIVFTCTDKNIENNDNLCVKAAEILFNLSAKNQGVAIHLEKKLPIGGGIGGGSSNCATTLLALNTLFGLNLSKDKLQTIGVKLGADVPIFVFGKSALATGIGDKFVEVNLPTGPLLVLAPNCHASTPIIFRSLTKADYSSPITMEEYLQYGANNDLQRAACENYPQIHQAISWLNNFAEAKMSGSGACVYACFTSSAEAKAVYSQVPPEFKAFLANRVNISPTQA